MAHELLHFWNGLSIVPTDSREEWFKEGVTDYLTIVTLARNGWLDGELLSKRLENVPRRYLIARFAQDLAQSGALQEQMEQVKTELLAHPAVAAFVDDLGAEAKSAIRRAATDPGGALKRSLAAAFADIGRAIVEDAVVREAGKGVRGGRRTRNSRSFSAIC